MSGVDFVQWLRDQLDEDERIAKDAASKAAAELATLDREEDYFKPPYDGSSWGRDYDHIFVVERRPGRRQRAQIADCGDGAFMLTPHIAEHDPARVLREIDAKRKLLDDLFPALEQTDGLVESEWNSHDDLAGKLLSLLALPYADRPGYLESWRL